MSVRPAKTQISLGIRSVWSVFAVRIKKALVLSYPLSAQRRLWSDWADVQADLSLRWAHSHFVGFVMSRLALQLGSSCCTCILCFSRFIKMWTHYFQKQICQCMPEKYSLKTPSKWFRLFHQIEQARLRLSGTTTTWQVSIELNGYIWCSLVKGYRACVTNTVFWSTDS